MKEILKDNILFEVFKKLEGKFMLRKDYDNKQYWANGWIAFFKVREVFHDKGETKIRLTRYDKDLIIETNERAMKLKNLADNWIVFDSENELKKYIVLRRLK